MDKGEASSLGEGSEAAQSALIELEESVSHAMDYAEHNNGERRRLRES